MSLTETQVLAILADSGWPGRKIVIIGATALGFYLCAFRKFRGVRFRYSAAGWIVLVPSKFVARQVLGAHGGAIGA